ncbi:GNAT family N-acetyltransferase [Flavobacterium selenitireducens]|uniref:GNAT family N-acetyltransferase n=1 Tax=Flavobacterium selenitireducens TaxID=2722704 RepID=UPI00168BBD77|nr:GNAT family N-acetyltransferase [Flavobacterium selenitireducens]MBD3582669.1 GNAT family N-acetyltransferase [Flavobacterium selenitireducens]
MTQFTVKRYQANDSRKWNDFNASSKNGTFLFDRGFMEYHSDRFDDFSLMAYEGGKLVALCPLHRKSDLAQSHWGLTYGGLVYASTINLKRVLLVFRAMLEFLSESGVETLQIKTIPAIYHKFPSDELLYALFVSGAKLTRRDSLSAIDLRKPFVTTKTRRQSIRRSQVNQLEIVEEANFAPFWNDILIPNLEARHGVQPVHSLEEIQMLHERFPENIRQFNVYHYGKLVAGTTVFETDTVAHPQYISANSEKNELNSLDRLYHFLIADAFKEKAFFDFGISNEEQGRKLNEGLVFWKESFGAHTVTQDFYEVATKNYRLLDTVLI